MSKSTAAVAGAALGTVALGSVGQAFIAGSPEVSSSTNAGTQHAAVRFLAAKPGAAAAGGLSFGSGAAIAATGLATAAAAVRRSRRSAAASAGTAVPVSLACSVAPQETYFRDQLTACRAQLEEMGAPAVEEVDQHMKELEGFAKQAVAGAAAAMVFTGSMESAVAYPIYAQQNYPNPREYTGKIACANCHLASKPIDVRLPQAVLPDTIFKVAIEIPAKYDKRTQPTADGTKGPMNVGAVAVMPEGWRLAPKDRLPKVLKKEMKGLAWSPYSKEYPNIAVAGPVPGSLYGEKMVLPVLSADPNTNNKVIFGKALMFFGGNRGRGQVYPEGNQSNNNQFFAEATGKITALDDKEMTIEQDDGTSVTQKIMPGADVVYTVGERVTKDDPITTNPNVGGFGQEEKEIILQDMNRVYAYTAFYFSVFIAQLTFVLKKKQFEKVQLAEGF